MKVLSSKQTGTIMAASDYSFVVRANSLYALDGDGKPVCEIKSILPIDMQVDDVDEVTEYVLKEPHKVEDHKTKKVKS
jgi:hypothetical protein